MKEASRVNRPRERAKASYDKLSKWYDVLVGRLEKRFRDAGLAKLNARNGENVLEIGFGTGYCLLALASAVGDSGKVYGLDISEGMLGIAKKKLEKAGLSKRTDLRCGDATNLPYPDAYFDAIFMSFALELFDTPDIPVVLQQCHRVLKNGGRLCVVAMSKEGNLSILTRIYEWAHGTFPNYVDCRPIPVTQVVEKAGFHITGATVMSMLSVPVQIIVAEKRRTLPNGGEQ